MILTLEKNIMTKYIKIPLNISAFLMVGLFAIAMVNAITVRKLDRLTNFDASNIETISTFKAAVKDKERRMQCMTQNIYLEAASEPAEGKLAVAQVVMNRVESGKFPQDPCQVVHQKNVVYERVLCQFSWYCDQAAKNKPVHKKLWDESAEAARMVMLEGFRIPELKGALYYHADYVNPGWDKKRVVKIGRHIFYKDN